MLQALKSLSAEKKKVEAQKIEVLYPKLSSSRGSSRRRRRGGSGIQPANDPLLNVPLPVDVGANLLHRLAHRLPTARHTNPTEELLHVGVLVLGAKMPSGLADDGVQAEGAAAEGGQNSGPVGLDELPGHQAAIGVPRHVLYRVGRVLGAHQRPVERRLQVAGEEVVVAGAAEGAQQEALLAGVRRPQIRLPDGGPLAVAAVLRAGVVDDVADVGRRLPPAGQPTGELGPRPADRPLVAEVDRRAEDDGAQLLLEERVRPSLRPAEPLHQAAHQSEGVPVQGGVLQHQRVEDAQVERRIDIQVADAHQREGVIEEAGSVGGRQKMAIRRRVDQLAD
ncbi:hypothetical protein TYRP_009832 [Tyrophagus putrescentiae]|nr:hypothetical protein TYRP_009832 [Tyrophagus putrescentiae]